MLQKTFLDVLVNICSMCYTKSTCIYALCRMDKERIHNVHLVPQCHICEDVVHGGLLTLL